MRSHPRSANAQTFFGWQTIPNGAKEVVITEGEIDAMTVWQETGIPAISVPNGASSFPDSLVHALRKVDKVILWYDNDMAGREGCEKAVSKLSQTYGFGKCLIVRPSETEILSAKKLTPSDQQANTLPALVEDRPKDANDFFLQGYDLKRLLLTKKPLKHERVLTASDLYNDIREEFMNPTSRKGKQFTAFPTLNSILGGFRPGELTLVSGPTGSGKTTLVSQLSLDLCMNGVPTLFGSFEIQVPRLQRILLSQFVYRNFFGEWSPQPERSGLFPNMNKEEEFRKYFSAYAELPMSFMDFFGSTSIESVINVMSHHVESQDVQHVIIDNLQYMVAGSGLEKDFRSKGGGGGLYNNFQKFEMMERALDHFRAFATSRKVHLTIVIHPKKVNEYSLLTLDSIVGSAKATQEVDNVICIQRLQDGRKTMDVKKNRYEGTLGRVDIAFDPNHKVFFDQGEHIATSAFSNFKTTNGFQGNNNNDGQQQSGMFSTSKRVVPWSSDLDMQVPAFLRRDIPADSPHEASDSNSHASFTESLKPVENASQPPRLTSQNGTNSTHGPTLNTWLSDLQKAEATVLPSLSGNVASPNDSEPPASPAAPAMQMEVSPPSDEDDVQRNSSPPLRQQMSNHDEMREQPGLSHQSTIEPQAGSPQQLLREMKNVPSSAPGPLMDQRGPETPRVDDRNMNKMLSQAEMNRREDDEEKHHQQGEGGFFSPNEDEAILEGGFDSVDGTEIEIFERIREDFLPHRDVHELMFRFRELQSLKKRPMAA